MIRFVAAVLHADLADDPDGHKRDDLVHLGQLAKVEHDTTRAELLDARRERDEYRACWHRDVTKGREAIAAANDGAEIDRADAVRLLRERDDALRLGEQRRAAAESMANARDEALGQLDSALAKLTRLREAVRRWAAQRENHIQAHDANEADEVASAYTLAAVELSYALRETGET